MPLPGQCSARPPQFPELKDAVRRLLGLDEDSAVVIRQLACTEPGCPPLETVIAVLPRDGPARRWTLHRPADQVTEDDLRRLLATAPEGA
ncbi:hypothetical protein [Streptomyces sp. GS7]|uniref:hypothetical protein n=1 Tax=Streptomyces sp. GS7 TaxID=2692234 RepID=UPI001315BFBA|nr:hypothetical protein [Streptomyces sp. GS7]QHC21459.1 hypothetical protein GR130_08515 [Streptomyces sp. GS7]